MQVHFWGVRGSIAGSSGSPSCYGHNTSCYSVETDTAPHIILDAGSGLRSLGKHLVKNDTSRKCVLFISHNHWDHISGLPFFAPMYNKNWEITIYAPECIGGTDPESFIKGIFSSAYFPVSWESLASTRHIYPLKDKQRIDFEGNISVSTFASNHGGEDFQGLYAAAFKVEDQKNSVFYSGDHEIGLSTETIDFKESFYEGLRGVDIAILDSQYNLEDYRKHVGWGHSSIEQWPSIINKLAVKTFIPTHFDPNYSDLFLNDLCNRLLLEKPSLSTKMRMAYEGLVLNPAHSAANVSPYPSDPDVADYGNCEFAAKLFDVPDMSSVLDTLLHKARELTHADAGTIYLLEDDELVFSYSHNDTLFTRAQSARQQYLNARLPIQPNSIAGYVAYKKTVLNIANVRQLEPDVPYAFNDSFDKSTGYLTVSICALPIMSQRGAFLGVMQLINCTENNEPVPFTARMVNTLRNLCFSGALAIEHAIRTKEMLLRVLETARMRDPTETGTHVVRVGAMAAELYHHWAEKRNIDLVEILNVKAHLRLASMLHDIGKVGISDSILKKPGSFNPEERFEMEKHCAIGAAIFKDRSQLLDDLSAVIAMHHHQKWDGTGYTGAPDVPLLKGEEIPVEARITSIVDVFDALISPRCYKKAFSVNKALEILKKDAGTHFDPELVDCFMEILSTMLDIQNKYQEETLEA